MELLGNLFGGLFGFLNAWLNGDVILGTVAGLGMAGVARAYFRSGTGSVIKAVIMLLVFAFFALLLLKALGWV